MALVGPRGSKELQDAQYVGHSHCTFKSICSHCFKAQLKMMLVFGLLLMILGAEGILASQRLPVQKYRKVLVDPDAWVANSTVPSAG